jgi:hypothetical protein
MQLSKKLPYPFPGTQKVVMTKPLFPNTSVDAIYECVGMVGLWLVND